MDLHRLDLNLLVTLDVLLAEQNVTRAARRLARSQPAVSAQLKQLREWFGDPLLLPAARGMTPTALALSLQQPLREQLASLAGFLGSQQPFDPATSTQTFHIASTDAVHATVSAPLTAHLQRVAPGVRLALHGARGDDLAEQLASGERDLLLTTPHTMPQSLRSRQLYQEHFLCVMRPDHPAAASPINLTQYCQLAHALVSTTGGGFSGAVDEALARQGLSRRVVVSLPSFLLVPTVLKNSDLIATIPARLARAWSEQLAVQSPPCEVGGFSIQMGWHSRSHADPAQIWLREQLLAIGQQSEPPPSGG